MQLGESFSLQIMGRKVLQVKSDEEPLLAPSTAEAESLEEQKFKMT